MWWLGLVGIAAWGGTARAAAPAEPPPIAEAPPELEPRGGPAASSEAGAPVVEVQLAQDLFLRDLLRLASTLRGAALVISDGGALEHVAAPLPAGWTGSAAELWSAVLSRLPGHGYQDAGDERCAWIVRVGSPPPSLDEQVMYASDALVAGSDLLGRRIVAVEPTRVVVEATGGTREVLRAPQGAPFAPAAVLAEELEPGRFRISRAAFERYTTSLDDLSREGRAAFVSAESGRSPGLQLSAIRRQGFVDQVGLENGDVLHAVGGHVLDSTQAAAWAWGELAKRSRFCLELTRQSQPHTLCYEVR